MNRLKTITAEINKLFSTDYNCSSFNALTNLQLLQIVVDVMSNFSIMQNVCVKTGKEKSILEILTTLEAIKYSPEIGINPTDFRNGLIEARNDVIYPLLYWLLRNEEVVQNRYYLSKFVTKIEIPEIDLGDVKLKYMHDNYCALIDQFWEAYKENKLEKQHAVETTELENDIFEMKRDMSNLKNHLRTQSNRISNISNKTAFLDLIYKLCKETKQRDKLMKQIEEENVCLEQLKSDLRKYERRDKINNLEDMLEKARCNTYYHNQLDKQCDDFKTELEIHESVSDEPEPNNLELENILRDIQDEKMCMQQLRTRKNSMSTDGTEASAQHLKVLKRKKDALSNEIMKLRLQNEELLYKIEQTCSLLGGDVLQGKSLKAYVAKLRERSLIYKKDKQYLNSIKKEVCVLERTLELLHMENPEIRNNLKAQIDTEELINKECRECDQDKIKLKVRKVHRSYEAARNEISTIDKCYRRTKFAFEELVEKHRESKNTFDEMTGNLTDSVRKSEIDLKRLQEKIKKENCDLRKYNDDTDFYKECLLKYSHGIIECAGDIPYIDGIAHKLDILEQKKDELLFKLDVKEEQKVKALEELEAIKKIKDMVSAKLTKE